MEVTNELKTKVFALYIGCQYQLTINIENTPVIEQLTIEKLHKLFEDYWQNELPNMKQAKLLLKPLSSITDEDKVGLCKILYPENENWSVNMHEADNCDPFLQSLHDIEEYHLFGIKYPMQKSIEAIDYLRSKGYMLPAYGINDLFESGIAIDTSTITDKSK